MIVNPSFRFKPFDLKNFASWAQTKSLSPYKPSVWIKTPVTEIETGFWISADNAEMIAKLGRGKPIPAGLDEKLARKLIAASIISTSDSLEITTRHWQCSLEEARHKFAVDKYAVLRGIFPPEQMRAMQRFYRQYVNQGFMPFGDDRVERRYGEHNEALASFLHLQLATLMSIVVGAKVKPSYAFAASYMEGSILPPHTDREQCEYSISFQVDYQPEPADNASPWAIYLEPLSCRDELPEIGFSFEWDQLDSSNSGRKPSRIYLATGDALIYKGRELIHYRHALPEGHRSTSLFFHFVAKDFTGELS